MQAAKHASVGVFPLHFSCLVGLTWHISPARQTFALPLQEGYLLECVSFTDGLLELYGGQRMVLAQQQNSNDNNLAVYQRPQIMI